MVGTVETGAEVVGAADEPGDGLGVEVGSAARGRGSGGVHALRTPTAPAVSRARLLSLPT